MKKSFKRRVFVSTNTPRKKLPGNTYFLFRFPEFRANTAPNEARQQLKDPANSRQPVPAVGPTTPIRKNNHLQLAPEDPSGARPMSSEMEAGLYLEEIDDSSARPPSRKKLPPGSQTGHYRKRNSLGDIHYEHLDTAKSIDDSVKKIQSKTDNIKPIPLYFNCRVKRTVSRDITKTHCPGNRGETAKNSRPHKKGILNTSLEPDFLKLFSRRG